MIDKIKPLNDKQIISTVLHNIKSQWHRKTQLHKTESFLESMLYEFHDAEEKMLSMTMRCDGPRSEEVLKRNKQNDKQLFHQVQRQENVK